MDQIDKDPASSTQIFDFWFVISSKWHIYEE